VISVATDIFKTNTNLLPSEKAEEQRNSDRAQMNKKYVSKIKTQDSVKIVQYYQ